ncbi:Phospholipid hydroperoxide glutathione, partial [Globisporangium splendens]
MELPLQGRVFTRLANFKTFPEEVQEDTKAVQALIIRNKDTVFQNNKAKFVKSVYSVKGKALIESIVKWLEVRQAEKAGRSGQTPGAATTMPTTDATSQHSPVVAPLSGEQGAGHYHTPMTSMGAHATESRSPEVTPTKGYGAGQQNSPSTNMGGPMAQDPSSQAASTNKEHHTPYGLSATVPARGICGSFQLAYHSRAGQIADALVLSGFLTPFDDDIKHTHVTPPKHFVHDNALLIPVAKEISRLPITSVWSVLDGVIYARYVKRKSGLLGKGKDVYVVLNEKTHRGYLFENDLARESISELDAAAIDVQFDHNPFDFGVRVGPTSGDMTHMKPEQFDCDTKHLQEEFVNAWLNIGAQYREAYNVEMERARSIYQFMDVNIYGNPISFDKYRGKVLLLVNVASNSKLAPQNYSELSMLYQKYCDQGFEVLAFPCNQFGSEEPGTNEQILEYVKQFDANCQFFEKADVNGAHARPVFTYLKAKLPGKFGNYIKWNFTKFLVDRNGVPYKRYAPTDNPLSFEHDIQELLNAPVAADQGLGGRSGLVQESGLTAGAAAQPIPEKMADPSGFAEGEHAGTRAPNVNQDQGQSGMTRSPGYGTTRQTGTPQMNQPMSHGMGQQPGTHAGLQPNQLESQQGMQQPIDHNMGSQGMTQPSGYSASEHASTHTPLQSNQFEGQQGMPQPTGYGTGEHMDTHAPQAGNYQGNQGMAQPSGYSKGEQTDTNAPLQSNQFEGQHGMAPRSGNYQQGEQGMAHPSGYSKSENMATGATPQTNQFEPHQDPNMANTYTHKPAGYTGTNAGEPQVP